MTIHWYPGHMTKTRRMMEDMLKQVDGVCEIVDARIPRSSRNPDIDTLAANLPRLIVLNRCDQADPNLTARWRKYFESCGYQVLETDCKNGGGIKQFPTAIRTLLAEKLRRYEEKGQIGRSVRLMIVGIPNVGKSTLINRISGRKAAKTEDRPGVTRAKQWFTLCKGIEALDTPGILWPKIDDEVVGQHLAFTGAIRDEILDIEELASKLLECLHKTAPNAVEQRYKFSSTGNGYEDLCTAGRKRGFLISGGEVDTERMSKILLDEYREGKLGRITLELPEDTDRG